MTQVCSHILSAHCSMSAVHDKHRCTVKCLPLGGLGYTFSPNEKGLVGSLLKSHLSLNAQSSAKCIVMSKKSRFYVTNTAV